MSQFWPILKVRSEDGDTYLLLLLPERHLLHVYQKADRVFSGVSLISGRVEGKASKSFQLPSC